METVTTRSRSNSGLNFLSLLEKSYRTPPGSDYWVTTMKLRERVTSGKDKTQRNIKSSLKSAPPFQKRNPDNYPMPHSREDVLRSAKGRKTEKLLRQKRNASTGAYSGNMRDYSKQMFDFAVFTANQDYSQDINKGIKRQIVNRPVKNANPNQDTTQNTGHAAKWAKAREQQERKSEDASRTNGPTPDGSILYNRRQKILNSIRIRPKSECDEPYHHDRSASKLSLYDTMMEKNQQYRVLNLHEAFYPGTPCGRSTSCTTDVLLVPVDADQSTERDFPRERKNNDSINDTIDDVFSEIIKNESRASTCDPFDDRDIVDGRKSRERCRLLPPSSTCNVRLVSLEEQSSSESEEEKEQLPPPPPPEQRKQDALKTQVKKSTRVSLTEPIPEIKPEKVKIVLKGPKCWVDDATVTSEQLEEEHEEEVVEPEPAPQLKGVLKSVLSMKQNMGTLAKVIASKEALSGNSKDLIKTGKGNNNKEPVKEISKPLPEPVVPEPVPQEPVKEEKEPEVEKPVSLPPFLCPSSERKSREAAIKDWLASCCFSSASSGVPLI